MLRKSRSPPQISALAPGSQTDPAQLHRNEMTSSNLDVHLPGGPGHGRDGIRPLWARGVAQRPRRNAAP